MRCPGKTSIFFMLLLMIPIVWLVLLFRSLWKNVFNYSLRAANGNMVLQYICTENLCGGWADRWKGAVLVYMISKRQKRQFRMRWDGPFALNHIFQPHGYFEPPPMSCTTYNWIDEGNPSISWDKNAPCVALRANKIPEKYAPQYDAAARELWNSLRLQPRLAKRLGQIEGGMRCAQIRNGKTKNFPDCSGCYGFQGSPKKAQHYEELIFRWLGTGSKTHLWTDSVEQEKRWLAVNPSTTFVEGPICHIDKNPSLPCLDRVMLQWALISKCHEVAPFSGFIRSGLFMRPDKSRIVNFEKRLR